MLLHGKLDELKMNKSVASFFNKIVTKKLECIIILTTNHAHKITQTIRDRCEKIIEMPDGDGLVMFYKILMAMEKLGTFFHSGLQITFNTEKELKLAQKQIIDFYTIREDL